MFTKQNRIDELLDQKFPSMSFWHAPDGSPFQLYCFSRDTKKLQAHFIVRSRNMTLNDFIVRWESKMLLNKQKFLLTQAVSKEVKQEQIVVAYYLQHDDILLVQQIIDKNGKLQVKLEEGPKKKDEDSIEAKVAQTEINRAIQAQMREAAARTYTNRSREPDLFNSANMARLGRW